MPAPVIKGQESGMKGTAIILDAITVKRQDAFAFDIWYANHYLPQFPGPDSILGLRRYGSPLRASYLAVIEARSLPPAATLPQPMHESILNAERFMGRSIGEHRGPGAAPDILEAPILYPVYFRVPVAREAEFNAWYEEEHMALLLRCPYWPMCRRFRLNNAEPGAWTHVALHYLTDLRALESEERTLARNTEWRARLAREEWFKGSYRVYHRHGGH